MGRPIAFCLALVVGLATLAAPAAAVPTAPPPIGPAAADPLLGAPALGSCYKMSLKEGNEPTYTEPAVDCAGKHSSVVVAVAQVSRRVLKGSLERLQRAASKSCGPAVREVLGGSVVTRAQTMYTYFWFRPTRAQQAEGARWLRCDLALVSVAGKKLSLRLPQDVRIRQPLPDVVNRCFSRRAGYVTCDRPHYLRATGAKQFAKQPYWSEARYRRIANRVCRSRTDSRRFGYTRPDRDEWRRGYRVVVCYTTTTQ